MTGPSGRWWDNLPSRGTFSVAGVDLSLSSTGVTRLAWEWAGDGPPLLFPFQRRIETAPMLNDTRAAIVKRMRKMRDGILDVLEDGGRLVLVALEAPAPAARGAHTHTLAGLWWNVFDALDAELGDRLVTVNPTHRAMYATGVGSGSGAGKDRVMAAAINRYPKHFDITGHDIADSTILAAMCSRRLGYVVEDSLPQTHLRAMDAVRWPEVVIPR